MINWKIKKIAFMRKLQQVLLTKISNLIKQLLDIISTNQYVSWLGRLDKNKKSTQFLNSEPWD